MSDGHRSAVRARRLLPLFTALVVALATAVVSLAFYTASGSGSGTAGAGTLPAPVITGSTPGAGTVALTWTGIAPSSGSGPVTYSVTRNGGAAAGNCPTTTSPSGGETCTDSGLGAGTYTYAVTVRSGSWTATSANVAVIVASGAAAQLVFTVQPVGGVAEGVAFGTSPVVAVRDAAGNPVTADTGTVTLTVNSGPASGVLSCVNGGFPAVGTVAGVASFTGCQLTGTAAAGTYTLRATRSGLAQAVSGNVVIQVGAASKLAFTTQPTGAVAEGVVFGASPVVAVQDSFSNTVTGGGGSVTLTVESGPSSGVLACANPGFPTIATAAGISSFTGCRITGTAAAGAYTLRATRAGLTAAVSDSVVIQVGAASKLAFTTQPVGGVAEDVAFGVSPVVSVQDSFSNTVTADVGSVTLAIDSGPASGVLSCANAGFPTATAAAGSAAFSSCRMTGAAAAGTYTLRATRPGLGQAVSAVLVIQAGPADRLAFTTQPGNSTGGVALGVQPRVTVQDRFGNQVATDASSVNLAIGTNPGGGLITCAANPVTAIGGIATFAGCAIDRSGTGYTLVATDGALGSATSAPFTVAVGPAARLAFTVQPGGALAGTSFTTQPSVTVQDAGGNAVTASTMPITLAIGTNPSGGALSCTSNPRTAVAGVATFAGCRITTAGVGYTLAARSGTLTAATSNPFDVARIPIARVGTGSTDTTARSGSLSPGLPTGLLPSDLMILVVANTRASTSAPPAGWTGVANVTTAVGADMSLSVFYRFYQTGVAAPSVAVNTDRGGASARIVAYRNVDTTAPLDVAAATSVSAQAAATFTGPGVTTFTPNALALSIVAQNDSGSSTPALAMISPQGFALEAGFPESPSVGNNRNHHALDLAGKLVAIPSTVTFPTFATDRFPRNSVWVGVSIVLR